MKRRTPSPIPGSPKAAYRASHREQYAAWRAAHREENRLYQRAHYAAHRAEKVAYQAAHREEIAARHAARYLAHREEAKEAARAYHASFGHPKQRGAEACDHSACLVVGAAALAWQTNEHTCYLCGTPVWQGVNLHMDHVLPISKGGLHCADNLRPACASCNWRKGARVAA